MSFRLNPERWVEVSRAKSVGWKIKSVLVGGKVYVKALRQEKWGPFEALKDHVAGEKNAK